MQSSLPFELVIVLLPSPILLLLIFVSVAEMYFIGNITFSHSLANAFIMKLVALFRFYSYPLMTIGCLISTLTVKLKFVLFLCKLLAQCQVEYLGLFTLFINLNFSSYYFRNSRNFGC